MATKKITNEQRAAIIKLLESGKRSSDIAEQVGVTSRQVAALRAHRTMRLDMHFGRSQEVSDQTASAQESNTSAKMSSTSHSASSASLSGVAVPLGRDSVSGEQIYWDADPDYGSANPHLMIVGESGFGKTYALQCLIAELAIRRMSSIIIDYGRGFDLETAPKELLIAATPKEVLAGENGINLNPLQIHSEDSSGPLNVAVRIADCFSRVYRIGVQQHAVLRDLVIELFKDFGITRAEKGSWSHSNPFLSDLNVKIDQISLKRSDRRASIALSLKSHLSTFFIFDTFRASGEALNWDCLRQDRGTTLIIQLRGLEGRTQKVVTEFLLWDLYHYVLRRGPHAVDCFCVLDEAHNLCFQDNTPIDKLIREARKFGLGLILASQQPTDFAQTVLANTASKLVFQAVDESHRLARQLAKKCIDYPDPNLLSQEVARLQKGEALFFAKNRGFKVKIQPLHERTLTKEL
jgi:DNA phosphorothioation-dependent restriction protein DptH